MLRVALCLLAIVGLASPARAQYRFEPWTADTGLPQNIITGLHHSPEGYLWIATLDGLARFDGVRFTVFNKNNTPGIEANRFVCLYADRQGDLWLGTESGSVTRYTRGAFRTYTSAHGLPANTVWGFTGDESGQVWLLSGEQIKRWDAAREQFVDVASPPISRGYGIMTWSERGGFWAQAGQGAAIVQDIIKFYQALGLTPAAYLDLLTTPEDLVAHFKQANFQDWESASSDLMLYLGPDIAGVGGSTEGARARCEGDQCRRLRRYGVRSA